MSDEVRDTHVVPPANAFDEDIEAHLDTMLAGTQRYFQMIGTEINTGDLKQMMLNRTVPNPNTRRIAMPSTTPNNRNTTTGPVRRTSPPVFHTLGPYNFPVFGIPLPMQTVFSPTGVEHFDAMLPFGAFSGARVPRLPAIPEEVIINEEAYSVDELCCIFAGSQEYSEGDICAICHDTLDEMTEENAHVQLLCKHRYHTKCLRQWLREKRNCPTCRDNVNIK